MYWCVQLYKLYRKGDDFHDLVVRYLGLSSLAVLKHLLFLQVDIDLCVQEVAPLFGPFVKYILDDPIKDPAVPTKNAFEIMLASQYKLSQPKLPPFIEERNNKDRLHNSILRLLESKELKWRSYTASTHGTHFVRTLTNVLWYIDGHHDVLQKQSLTIPKVFQNFTGYNMPEQSKHRKHRMQNLEQPKLASLSSELYELLLAPYWDQMGWNVFKPEVEQVADSLRSYSDLLRKQQLRMKVAHASPTPVRTLSDRLSVKFLKKSRTNDPLYGELNTDVLKVPPYQILSLCKYLPEDKHGRYTYISNLSENLLQECILITDSPGNNVGNAYFLIPVQDADSGCQTGEESKCTGGDQEGTTRISYSGNASHSF